jgi:pimeloyl-ACP methyl ester carboxylesterase
MRMPWTPPAPAVPAADGSRDLAPSIVEAAGAPADVLTVRTDSGTPAAAGEAPLVRVEVIAPGGRAVAEKDAPRGQTASLQTSAWPDGPYEVRCTTTAPNGRRLVKHLAWFKGDSLAAVRRLIEAAAKADMATPDGIVLAMLADMVHDRLGPNLEKAGPEPWRRVHSALMEFEELRLMHAGEPGGVRPYGFVRMAWRDDVDDSPQLCRVYFPPDYTPARKWPMVISLHGYHPDNPPYVRWWGVDQRHSGLADRGGAIVLEPHGRGNTSYMGLGDQDVRRCLAMARQQFSVDENRVYLMGYSMGGGGTWHVATRHPELFAAAGPIYGGWDYHVTLDAAELAALTPRQKFLRERAGSFALADALLTTPVFVNHGDADVLVDVNHSRYAVLMLERWGYDVRYWEHPGLGHGALGCEKVLLDWFLGHTRDCCPAHVRVRAGWLKDAAAHWVRVEQRADPWAFIVADAELIGPNTVRLGTENALEVTLTPRAVQPSGGGALIDPSKPLTVLWNGKAITQPFSKDGRVTVRDAAYVPGTSAKKPSLEGPIADATCTPFAIVTGTISTDPLMRRLCEREARRMASEWETWQYRRPRVFKDTEMAEADVAKYSCLLVGGPDANAVTRSLAARLPLAIAPGEVALAGHALAAPDAAVRAIFPNPLNPDRYVVVTAATSAKGMFFAPLLAEDVDFAVDDGRLAEPETGRTEDKIRLACGYFDNAWKWNDAYAERGDPVLRETCPVRKVPEVLAAKDAPGSRLDLGNLLENFAEGSFVRMGRDTNWEGKPLALGGRTYRHGIAVRTEHKPCAAEYDLAGAGWQRLRSTIGIEIKDPAKLEPKHKENTRVVFIVKGDGQVLFRSEPFRWDSPPQDLDVDVGGIKTLRIEVMNEAQWFCAATSVDWADLHLER